MTTTDDPAFQDKLKAMLTEMQGSAGVRPPADSSPPAGGEQPAPPTGPIRVEVAEPTPTNNEHVAQMLAQMQTHAGVRAPKTTA